MLNDMDLNTMTGAEALARADRDGYGGPLSRFGIVHQLRRLDALEAQQVPKSIVVDDLYARDRWTVGALFTIHGHGDALWEVVQVSPTDDGRTQLTIARRAPATHGQR